MLDEGLKCSPKSMFRYDYVFLWNVHVLVDIEYHREVLDEKEENQSECGLPLFSVVILPEDVN